MHQLDLLAWPRREHFDFYRSFEQPFWGVTVEVDVGALTARCSADGGSFFLRLLWCCQSAINRVEPLRMRIRGDQVVVHDVVHPGTTVLREDQTFGFADLVYRAELATFESHGRVVLDRAKEPGPLTPNTGRDDLILYSVLPWVGFTSFRHAQRCPAEDSMPRVVFGRRSNSGLGPRVPVSIEAHHALVDGLHVGQWLDAFRAELAGIGDAR